MIGVSFSFLLLTWLGMSEADYTVNFDYKGRECISHCHNKPNGKDNFLENNKDKSEYNYCFVDASHNWGYCSPDSSTTSHFLSCKSSHKCDKHGYSYNWCYTTDDNWDYCSPPSETRPGSRHYDSDGYTCKHTCDTHRGTTYNWCEHSFGWGYCSKQDNIASNGKVCLETSPCSHYHEGKFKSYRWCYTQGGSWDYCGAIDSCDFGDRYRGGSGRQQAYNLLCKTKMDGNLFRFLFVRNSPVVHFYRKDNNRPYLVSTLINEYNGYVPNKLGTITAFGAEGDRVNDNTHVISLARKANFVDASGYPWTNLQIQLNQVTGGNSTLAEVHFRSYGRQPSAEEFKLALRESFLGGTITCLIFSNDQNEQPCPIF